MRFSSSIERVPLFFSFDFFEYYGHWIWERLEKSPSVTFIEIFFRKLCARENSVIIGFIRVSFGSLEALNFRPVWGSSRVLENGQRHPERRKALRLGALFSLSLNGRLPKRYASIMVIFKQEISALIE